MPDSEVCGQRLRGDRLCGRASEHTPPHRSGLSLRKSSARSRDYRVEHKDETAARNREYRKNNREARNAYNREWNAEHLEAAQEYHRQYRAVHPEINRLMARRRRAREKGVPHEDWTRGQVVCLYGDRCYLCGGPYEHTDHVIPLSRGGWDVLANLRPSCARCNIRKRDKILPVVAFAVTHLVLSQVGHARSSLVLGRESD